jgi:hypothetical protein
VTTGATTSMMNQPTTRHDDGSLSLPLFIDWCDKTYGTGPCPQWRAIMRSKGSETTGASRRW